MTYDAQNRIMSLSFRRNREQQADVILAAGKRCFTSKPSVKRGHFLIGCVALGSLVGLAMEAYRRLLLQPLLGIEQVAPLPIILLQMAPFLIVVGAAAYYMSRHGNRLQRQALIDRLEPDLYVDIDIFRDGLRSTSGAVTLTMDWLAVRQILTLRDRIEVEGESMTTFIPSNAFASRQDFDKASAQWRTLWLEAKARHKRDRADMPAVAHGVDGAGFRA